MKIICIIVTLFSITLTKGISFPQAYPKDNTLLTIQITYNLFYT